MAPKKAFPLPVHHIDDAKNAKFVARVEPLVHWICRQTNREAGRQTSTQSHSIVKLSVLLARKPPGRPMTQTRPTAHTHGE